ncbi:MAG: hypothetical protein ACFCU8_18145 [Thermosynechococcaceae cyanobacterium]
MHYIVETDKSFTQASADLEAIDAKYLQKGFGYFVLAVAVFVPIRR